MTNLPGGSVITLAPFLELIETRLGLKIPAKDYTILRQKLAQRLQIHNLGNTSSYIQLLSQDDRVAEQEWSVLTTQLTNIESYFFRDQGQFALLRDRLLPDLIKRNQPQRRLSLWSAGCSTGAEPYSLAILLAQLLPDPTQWDCQIWGTDINPVVLAQARTGLYPAWSLRGVSAMERSQYFTPQPQGGYLLNSQIREGVQFKPFNLATGELWTNGGIDLILCRNVFIYFSQPAIARALHTLSQALRPGGYLLTGHAELYNQALPGLSTQLFPDSLVYQRNSTPADCVQPPSEAVLPSLHPLPNWLRPAAAPPVRSLQFKRSASTPAPFNRRTSSSSPQLPAPETRPTLLQAAQTALTQKNYATARQYLQQLLNQDPRNFEGHHLQAQLEANIGNYEQAQKWCEAALQIQPLSIAIYYLWADIATETDHTEEAKRLLKKIIYLEPTEIAAYYALRSIYQQENHTQRVQKLDAIALQLLDALPPDHQLAAPLNMTVEQLRDRLTQ